MKRPKDFKITSEKLGPPIESSFLDEAPRPIAWPHRILAEDEETTRIEIVDGRFGISVTSKSATIERTGLMVALTPERATEIAEGLLEWALDEKRKLLAAQIAGRLTEATGVEHAVLHGVTPALEDRCALAVDDIIADISDRNGLQSAWASVDDKIQEEIKTEWRGIIARRVKP